MTYFLADRPEFTPENLTPARDTAGAGIPTGMQAWGASFRKAQIENDSNFLIQRRSREIVGNRAAQAIERMDQDRLAEELRQRGVYVEGALPGEAVRFNPKAAAVALEMARREATSNPDAWKDLDLSDEGLRKEIDDSLKADYQEQLDILAMAPESPVRDLIAGMAGVTADIKNVPFLFLGGGAGTFARVAAREAAINMAAEASFLPSQFEMAERLEIEDPNVVSQLALAAGAGGLLGAGVEAARRAAGYLLRRDGLDGSVAASDVLRTDRVEDILTSNVPDPMRLVREAFVQPEPAPPPGRPPLILRDPIEVTNIDGGPLPDDQVVRTAESAIDEAERRVVEIDEEILASDPRMRLQSPFARQIAKMGGIQYRRKVEGGWVINPVAQDLAAAGITPRSHPWLFRKNGMGDVDNIDPAQIGRDFQGVLPDDGRYLDRQAVIDAIIRDVTTNEKVPLSLAIRDMMEQQRSATRITPQDDYLRMERSEGGLFIDKNLYDFDRSEIEARDAIRSDVEKWLDENGHTERLSDGIREEIIAQIQKDGGELEFLVEQAYVRDAEWALRPDEERPEDIPFADDDPRSGQRAPATDPFPPEGGSGPRGEGGAGESAFPTARTPEGEQFLVLGTERVDTGQAQRDRAYIAAQQQQSMIRRGNQTRVEDDAGGLFGGAQSDMFSDPLSPEARTVQDSIAADFRDQIEAGNDFMVDMGDGKGVRSAASVLDDLDANDEFADVLSLCGTPRTTT